MILYIENPKDSTRKVLELINEYSKFAGYKINIQKSLAFLYTNNERIDLGWEDSLEKKMATYSSILVCEIPITEEPGGLSYHGVATS